MSTLSPRSRAVFAYCATRVRLPVRREHLELEGNAALLEVVDRGLHALAVGLRADEDADEGSLSHRCRDDTAHSEMRSTAE